MIYAYKVNILIKEGEDITVEYNLEELKKKDLLKRIDPDKADIGDS